MEQSGSLLRVIGEGGAACLSAGCGMSAIGVFGLRLWWQGLIGRFLGGATKFGPISRTASVKAAAGWGRKPSGERAARFAERNGVPCLWLEDGFLRSVGLGRQGAAPLSLVVDEVGIYFDATRPSRLEQLLNGEAFAPELLVRAARVMRSIVDNNLSKYNHAPDAPPGLLPDSGRKRVLVIDQTAHDDSIRYGLASAASFGEMLGAACREHPGADIYIKTHPDVIAGKKASCLSAERGRAGVRWISEDVSPLSLLRQVDHVYAVTSQMGFEALLLDKPVTCFGMPFYAGWGVTDDRMQCPRRTRVRSVLDIFAAAYLLYPRYVDPASGQRCEIERVIEHLALQRQYVNANRGRLFCFGFTPWKRGYVRGFLKAPGNAVHFVRSVRHARRLGIRHGDRMLVWGFREVPGLQALADGLGIHPERVEDGFIRSVGLGSDFIRPLSLVVDRRGIYFDPRQPSDLEHILQHAAFSPQDLARGAALRQRLLEQGVSKYNAAFRGGSLPALPAGRRVVLVPGQVEDDASIRLGCVDVRTNEALLRAARGALPQAFLIYKPHPDVLSGNRSGQVSVQTLAGLCDAVVTDAPLADCLALADEVHTMTSLVGFEALLRGRRVVVYGLPFYAGWGLTDDRHRLARRNRRLTLDELVAGVLLHYPRYYDYRMRAFMTAEAAVDAIIEDRGKAAAQGFGAPWWVRQQRKLVNLWRGLTHG